MARVKSTGLKRSKLRQQGTAQTGPLPPAPQDRAELRRRLVVAQTKVGKAKREKAGFFPVLLARLELLIAKSNLFRPVRAFQLYSMRHGPLMAAGSGYTMFFSVASMLVAGFSIFGLVANGNRELQNIVVQAIDRSTPGLINTGSGGLVRPEDIFSSGGGFSWALVISLVALLFTSLGWIGGLREGIRGVFGAGPPLANPVLVKLKDILTLLVLGVVLVLTSVVSFGAATALSWVSSLLSLQAAWAGPLVNGASALFTLVLDLAVALALFRVVADVEMPRASLWQAALITAIGSTILRSASSLLLANVAGRVSFLAPFSVILGLFVWFYLLSQVYLLSAAWGAIGQADAEQNSAKTPRS
ncbi:YihY/virulence factor BrkB family protein [Psychromicrobium sp. YIM B11713]|uniref:YihY/virulence factor BrkB family protein n=1 Tax=Psychromicrobium sp. YIM B11713 TaxID=3145233 RepID=UPI00374F30D4